MATVAELEYFLDVDPVVPWNDQQPISYAEDECPFTLDTTSPESHVQQSYLQFLWFPEELMPLKLLVPALQRVQPGPSSSTVHPLHALLDPLLHTTRSASSKYRVDLAHILSVGEGGGEIEEMTMWFTLNSEISPETGEGLWLDEEWRKEYLERMERREVQIQILFYMLKLSLPGDFPPPPPPSPSKTSKRGKKEFNRKKKDKEDPRQSTLTILEAFMDKLSTWQIMQFVQLADRQLNANEKNERDWMQIFCEDIVEPLFKDSLPEQCTLLRSKLFQDIPTDQESDTSPNHATSQSDLRPFKRSRTATAEPSTSRHPSPALSTVSHTRRQTTSSSFSRSRSLSVSLAQEQEEQTRSRQAMEKKKRTLNREISMSRKFKPPPAKAHPPVTSAKEKEKAEDEKAKSKKKEKELGTMLVEDTPVRSHSKTKKSFEVDKFRSNSKRGPLFGAATLPGINTKTASSSSTSTTVVEEDGDDEVWMIKSSPQVVLLHGGSASDEDASGEDDDQMAILDTPTKKRRSADRTYPIPYLT